jgi:hypothetical protein
MTGEEWKEKYYPVEASDCPKDEAIAHSIRKWEGVAWAVQNHIAVPIRVDASTCTLCIYFYGTSAEGESRCLRCPLAISLGYRCDEGTDNEESPWGAYYNNKDPFPMLKALHAIKP